MGWIYYVVGYAWVVRLSDEGFGMDILQADGSWLPDTDIGWAHKDGVRLANEAEAIQWARELFEQRGVPHALEPRDQDR
jgi:hypothetical protein